MTPGQGSGRPLRIALLGLDHWYGVLPLARALAAAPGTELACVVDGNLDHAKEVAGRFDVPVADTDPAPYLEDPSIDVVVNFFSPERAAAISIAAARRGKDIVSVKPLARTLDEGTLVLRAVRRAGVRFVPAECLTRLTPFQKQLRGWLGEGRLGEALSGSYQLSGVLPEAWSDDPGAGWWIDTARAPGGAWIDHSIYHIDMFRWLTGARVRRVSGVRGNLRFPELAVEDYGHAVVEFDSGFVATVEDTWLAAPGRSRTTMSLVGTAGAVGFDTLSGKLSLAHGPGGWEHQDAPERNAPDVAELLAALRGEAELPGTVEDAWQNLAACHAFYTAARTGTAVEPAALPAR